MARWGVAASKGAGNVQGVVYLNAASANPRRAKVVDWSMGISGSPADAAFAWIAQRCTTAPTGAAKTPNALDPADSLASTIVANDTITADGTLTAAAFLYRVPLNQRASFRWVAAPYCEMIIPATANNGIMFGFASASAQVADSGLIYEEY